MDNILHFPVTTIVDKPVPKNAFFRHAPEGQRAPLQRMLTDEFDGITWLYKLTASTLNVEDGQRVHEIDVFYCRMKVDIYSVNPFCAMDKLLPRHTIFLVEYGGKLDFLMHHKEKVIVKGEEKWVCGVSEYRKNVSVDGNQKLVIEGHNMDSVYNGLLSQVSGLHVTTDEEYKKQAELRKQIVLMEKQIKALQKQVRTEKQFNRQIELNSETRRLKAKLAELKNQLETK